MLVLGGSLRHRGGIEAFCERTVEALARHGTRWRATWWTTDNAYLSWAGLGPALRAWRRLGTIDKHCVDVVWLQWSTLADLILLRRVVALGLPVMVTPHLGANARLQRSRILRAICMHLVAKADRLALLFDEQAGEIALPDMPTSLLGTFLPEEALAASTTPHPAGPLRLIHAGRLSREKGTFRLVAICAVLHARGIPFQARIVGRAEPDVTAAIKSAIADAGLERSIELAGWMEGPALREALGQADVLVHLSELDSFPLIVLEALAAGALPIVSDMAGAASMVRRFDGLTVPNSDVAAAADWLMGTEPQTIRRRGAQAALLVRADLAWPNIVAELEDVADAALACR
jgi:glycosyltransferase involved in cell wall biosynthesis